MAVYKDNNGTWYISVRYVNWKGEHARKVKRGFATKREATDWERNFLHENAGNLDMTFETFVDLYKKNLKERLKLSTWQTKVSIIDTKILPYFKKKRINDIKVSDVVAWQNTLLNMADENGERYSLVYLKTIHNQLSAIFNHAVRYYDLPSNPAAKAGNMGKEKTREMLYWTKDEYIQFSNAIMDKPNLPDDPMSKVNMCVDNIFRIWEEGQADKLTQLVFCDLSTPKNAAPSKRAAKATVGNLDSPEIHALEMLAEKDGGDDEKGFTVYDDIREKLVNMGIPREQIAFIHEANTEARKHLTFTHADFKQNIRMYTLGDEYSEDAIRAIIKGQRTHTPKKRRAVWDTNRAQSIIDIQAKLAAGKGEGYRRWATVENLKRMVKTKLYMDERGLSYEEMAERKETLAKKERELSEKVTQSQSRLAEINVLKTHIVNYSKTRDIYVAYRKSGYSKKFLEEHEADIIIHKAAKKAFDEMGVKKLPTIKSLQVEFAELLTAKKEAYAELKKVRDELRDPSVHKANYEELRDLEEREQHKEKEHGRE